MRILQVCHHFHPCIGGMEKYVEDLCTHLVNRGHVSDVVCLNTCAKSRERLPSGEVYQEAGIRKRIKITRLPYLDLFFYKVAPGVLRRLEGYDVVHVHGMGFFSDFLALTGFFHRKPLILSTHGGIFHTRRLAWLKKAYFGLWGRLVLRRFRRVIAISKSDEALFSKICRVTYVPVGINVGEFSWAGEGGVEKEENSLLFVGRISRNKRIDRMIETVYFLKEKVPGVRLYVLGEDWEGLLRDLKKTVRDRGLEENVFFEGAVEDREKLVSHYRRSQVFVSASEYEGFGISVLEAMAAGTTVAVSDIPAFRNFIRPGENGFLLDYSRPREAAERLASLLSRDMPRVRAEARRTAEEYDWSRVAEKIEKIYRDSLII